MGTTLSDINHHGFIQIMEEDGGRLEAHLPRNGLKANPTLNFPVI